MKTYRGVTVRGNSIQITFTWNGERYRETLRMPPTAPNMKAANRLRETTLRDIDLGKFDHKRYLELFPNSSKAKSMAISTADFLTVDQALWGWIRGQRNYLEASTLRDYTSAIKHHLSPKFGLKVVGSLTHQDVNEWLAELAISNKRKNNIIIPLRKCFQALYLDEVIENNPLLRVLNLKVQTREPEPFNNEEIKAILSALDSPETIPYRNLVQFAFGSGLRTSELIALTWDDVDFDRNRLTVNKARVRGNLKEPKTRSGKRFVELTPLALSALQQQQIFKTRSPNEVFFNCQQLSPLDDQFIRKSIWKPALRRAQVKYRSPYQTRHTYASNLLIDGKNPMFVANQMGHSDWGMIRKVYGRWIQN